jgi:hypothetical protein
MARLTLNSSVHDLFFLPSSFFVHRAHSVVEGNHVES